MIVAARMKGVADQAVTTAWHGEAFHRTKRLEPLAKILAPPPDPKTKRAGGAARVASMFKRNLEKKGGSDGSR